NPRHKDAVFYRGRMRVVAGKWADAEQDFDRAVTLDPGYDYATAWRGVMRGKLGRYREAAADAAAAARSAATEPEVLVTAARAYATAVRGAEADAAEPDRDGLADGYGKRAGELVVRAADRGFGGARR